VYFQRSDALALRGFLKSKEKPMLGWAVTFLIIAIIAGVLGFGGIAGTSAGIAQILFVIFIILFVISLVRGMMTR
jgi:uncharacterized membrane protein YtjA (UPF0391 family)